MNSDAVIVFTQTRKSEGYAARAIHPARRLSFRRSRPRRLPRAVGGVARLPVARNLASLPFPFLFVFPSSSVYLIISVWVYRRIQTNTSAQSHTRMCTHTVTHTHTNAHTDIHTDTFINLTRILSIVF